MTPVRGTSEPALKMRLIFMVVYWEVGELGSTDTRCLTTSFFLLLSQSFVPRLAVS